jgi:hypothetical protein
MSKRLATLPLLVLGSILASAQQGMNNDNVGKMIKAGLSDDIIIKTIRANGGDYDTSADGLTALKAAGASDQVIKAIQGQVLWLNSNHVLIGSIASGPAAKPKEPEVKEPDEMGKVFFLNPATKDLEPLPGERWKRKNRAVFGSFKAVDLVKGTRSNYRISSKDKIVFIFRPLPGLFTATLRDIRIFPFELKGDGRECVVSTTKSGFVGATNTGNENTISLGIVRYGNSSYALGPPGFHLDPGEYSISVPGAGLNDPLITFGVD